MVKFNHHEIHWDQVPENLTASSMSDLTPEQKSKALEWARDHAERLPEMGGVEFWMAQYFSHTIDDVQRHQFVRRMPYDAVVYPDGKVEVNPDSKYADIMREIESWQDWQETRVSLQQFAEAVGNVVKQLGYSFEAVAKSLQQALNTAAPALQELLDQMGAQPSEPAIKRAHCPSHGRPMKGGRCTMCDRRR